MDCIECKTTNPDDNRFCGKCGAELGRSLEESARRAFRDRNVVEMEITESVAGRLMKWATWLGSIVAVIVALLAVVLGKGCMEVHTAVESGKAEIASTVLQGKKDIEPALASARREVSELQQSTDDLKRQYAQLQSDIGRYQQVNQTIEKLQKRLNAVQDQVIDLGGHSLKAHTIETTGTEPSSIALGNLGCSSSSALEGGRPIALCAQGSPPAFFQVTSTGVRAVASSSPTGYQDTSNAPKPNCNASTRGTFYVEKGSGNVADKPFLCIKVSDSTYSWIQLAASKQ